jgi:hypothetical protein
MKTISLPAAAASLLLWAAPGTDISPAAQPQLEGSLALALAGTALIALGAAWTRRNNRNKTQATFQPEPAFTQPQASFFRETDMTSQVFGRNNYGGAEVIELAVVRHAREQIEPMREDGLTQALGIALERQLNERAARVCGRYMNQERNEHAREILEA